MEMPRIDATCQPKIRDLLWLQPRENDHRSRNIFENKNYCQLRARRCDSALWNHIIANGIPDEVFEHISNAGFGGVFSTWYHKIDHGLIRALVERWRPETHTFHFPIGEATVTLQDVQVLWGLPIDGPVVSGEWESSDEFGWAYTCQHLLGIEPVQGEINAGKIKIRYLVSHLDDHLLPNDESYQKRARIYILAAFAGHLFADSTNNDVSLNFLANLVDLRRDHRKSWGSAVLACLYRNLCKATNPNTVGIQGPLMLLQYWAWERMPLIAPRLVTGEDYAYNYQQCYAARGNCSLSNKDTPAHVEVTYRAAFTALKNHQFLWRPYDQFVHLLPDDCWDG